MRKKGKSWGTLPMQIRDTAGTLLSEQSYMQMKRVEDLKMEDWIAVRKQMRDFVREQEEMMTRGCEKCTGTDPVDLPVGQRLFIRAGVVFMAISVTGRKRKNYGPSPIPMFTRQSGKVFGVVPRQPDRSKTRLNAFVPIWKITFTRSKTSVCPKQRR